MCKPFGKKEADLLQLVSWNLSGPCDFEKPDCKIRQVRAFLQEYVDWDIFMCQEHKLDDNKIKAGRLFQTIEPIW